MQKKRGKLRQLFRNLRYLAKTDLRAELDNRFVEFEDYYRYMLRDEPLIIPRPRILNAEETIQFLLDNPKSFCRIGDGELTIIDGGNISFQRWDQRLANYLLEIAKSNSKDLHVGLPYALFHTTDQTPEFSKDFFRRTGYEQRRHILSICNMNRIYIDAGFNQFYLCTKWGGTSSILIM